MSDTGENEEICEILYRVGILGIKRNASMPVEYYFDELMHLSKSDFLNDVKIYVHKAFYSVFRINVQET